MSVINYEVLKFNDYIESLKLVAGLSTLFSDNDVPMLNYRAMEIQYCRVFSAKNVTRSDLAIDAVFGNVGVGLKTFISKTDHSSYQKIAEFNQARPLFENLNDFELINLIAELRNKRLDFVVSLFNLQDLIYHCVTREKSIISVYEEKMVFIGTIEVDNIERNKNQIYFSDGIEKYKFDVSKSTLYKLFKPTNVDATIHVNILRDPIALLQRATNEDFHHSRDFQSIILPLYSYKKGAQNIVYPKSGLNQWNADGRERHNDEVYIPIPKIVRDKYPDFFPNRKTSFDVQLPNQNVIKMKVCQDGGKALMSNPNRLLGKWLLRDVLKINEATLITYDDLLKIGVDSVEIIKLEEKYLLDFKDVGTFEDFIDS